MTRHRSPRGRGAPQQDRHRHSSAHDHTAPFTAPAGAVRGAARHRSPARSALRHGALTAGIAGGALAVGGVAIPMLSITESEPAGTLALSTQSSATAQPAAVTPAAQPVAAPSGAISSDLIKAVDRQRRAVAERVAAEREAEQAEADRAEEARAAAEERERRTSLDCGVADTYDGVADSVQTVGNAMECVFPGHQVLGIGERGNASDHPDGYALDFMTDSGSGSGDTIADCVMSNADALGVEYAIWNQRINTGSGWEAMEDRGGRTANHEDHVHISFSRGASPDVAALRGCGGSDSSDKA